MSKQESDALLTEADSTAWFTTCNLCAEIIFSRDFELCLFNDDYSQQKKVYADRTTG